MDASTSDRQISRRSGKDRRKSLTPPPVALLRMPDVVKLCGMSRSSIYDAIKFGTFPQPIKLNNSRASAWIYDEIVQWITHATQNCRRTSTR